MKAVITKYTPSVKDLVLKTLKGAIVATFKEVPSDGDASLMTMSMVSTILKDEPMLQDEKFKGYVTSGHRYGALRTASGGAEKEMKLKITSFLQASSIPQLSAAAPSSMC